VSEGLRGYQRLSGAPLTPNILESKAMTKIDDGGPAFPTHETADFYPPTGMSLRDWFAGQVVSGMAAQFDAKTLYATALEGRHPASVITQWAYTIADAMIAARKTGGE